MVACLPCQSLCLCLKTVDILLQIISLEKILEKGFPPDLCYSYAGMIAVDALSCVVAVPTPAHRLTFYETVLDCLYGALSVLMEVYRSGLRSVRVLMTTVLDWLCDAQLWSVLRSRRSSHRDGVQLSQLPSDHHAIGGGDLERPARGMADPTQVFQPLVIFDELRILSALDYVLRIGLSVACYYRLKRTIEVRIRQRRKLKYNERERAMMAIQVAASESRVQGHGAAVNRRWSVRSRVHASLRRSVGCSL